MIVFKYIHSGIAYLAVIALVFTVIWAVYRRQASFEKKDKVIAIISMTLVHLQLVFGLVLYFSFHHYQLSSQVMQIPAQRLLALEHPLMMLIGIVLITIGYSKSKRTEGDAKKFKLIYSLYGIGTLLILSRIPYGQWFS